jgi:hypothetical protein
VLYQAPASLLVLLPLAAVAAVLLGPRIARALGAGRGVGVLLALSVGLILVITLVPMPPGFGPDEPLSCLVPDLRVLASSSLRRVSDESLNVVLFVPLGIAIALLPRARRLPVLALAALFPWVIEVTQLLLPALNRSCQSVDLTTNLLGLGIGFGLGLAILEVASLRAAR